MSKAAVTLRTKRELAEAEKAWKSFTSSLTHPRKTADWVAELHKPWPKRWVYVGEAQESRYLSDKWHKKGEAERYYHEHEPGVHVWLSAEVAEQVGLERCEVPDNAEPPELPQAVAFLAVALAVDIVTPTGIKGTLTPDLGSALVCSPDGKTLYIIEGDRQSGKVITVISGGTLHVEPRGIVG